MNRRSLLKALVTLPFVPNAIELLSKIPVANRYLPLSSLQAILAEIYSGQQIKDLVYRNNVLLRAVTDPEYMKPENVLARRKIRLRNDLVTFHNECKTSRYSHWARVYLMDELNARLPNVVFDKYCPSDRAFLVGSPSDPQDDPRPYSAMVFGLDRDKKLVRLDWSKRRTKGERLLDHWYSVRCWIARKILRVTVE